MCRLLSGVFALRSSRQKMPSPPPSPGKGGEEQGTGRTARRPLWETFARHKLPSRPYSPPSPDSVLSNVASLHISPSLRRPMWRASHTKVVPVEVHEMPSEAAATEPDAVSALEKPRPTEAGRFGMSHSPSEWALARRRIWETLDREGLIQERVPRSVLDKPPEI